MKVWIISGEGMPVYGYWSSEEKAREAWAKFEPHCTLNSDNYGPHVYCLELIDNEPLKEENW